MRDRLDVLVVAFPKGVLFHVTCPEHARITKGKKFVSRAEYLHEDITEMVKEFYT